MVLNGKDEALAAGEAAHPISCDEVYETICTLANRGANFTADDVYPLLGGPLSSVYTVGAAFNRALKHGVIAEVPVPPVNSRRNNNHGHPLRTWRGMRAA